MLEMEAELPLSNAQLYAELKKEMKGAGGHGKSVRRRIHRFLRHGNFPPLDPIGRGSYLDGHQTVGICNPRCDGFYLRGLLRWWCLLVSQPMVTLQPP